MLKKSLILFFVLSVILKAQVYSDKDVEICKSKFKLAVDKNLENESIGDVIAAIGKSFLGTDYVAHTLEKGKKETLVIDLTGLDCTTFLENDLTFARCIKEKKTSFDDYINELKKIRYRNGVIDQYPSRLHYFSDWIYDNVKKGIVKNISKELGGEQIMFDVHFISKHPDLYVQLKENPSFIHEIKKQEEEINQREYYFIPKEKVAQIEKKIHNGDLIAITTDEKGLDIGHVGIAVKMDDGRVHFMHAPNVGYKVQITDMPLPDYIAKIKKDTGIIVMRAAEPEN
ncbi:MAG: N-acetylmuramoyl-L-alanine amidase-like domain-containing protein [Ignavibacteriaceae bacterium]